MNIYPLDKEHLLEQAAFLREVKVVCCLPTPFSLKTIQTRVGRAILTAIFRACTAHETTLFILHLINDTKIDAYKILHQCKFLKITLISHNTVYCKDEIKIVKKNFTCHKLSLTSPGLSISTGSPPKSPASNVSHP